MGYNNSCYLICIIVFHCRLNFICYYEDIPHCNVLKINSKFYIYFNMLLHIFKFLFDNILYNFIYSYIIILFAL